MGGNFFFRHGRAKIDTKAKDNGRAKHQKFWKGHQHFELIMLMGCRRQPGGVSAWLPSLLPLDAKAQAKDDFRR